ncbi:MAG: helix-turn-helix domain-containing protein, partial [Cyanobacteria bacterium J06626_26]
MASAASADTKEQLLNVAEQLIAERGYAGTTVRAIATQANANLAAVNYHFGSKEELFRAIFSRIARPIVVDQLAMLEKLQQKESPPSVE